MSKVKIVKKQIKDDNLIEMFNQMIGGNGNPKIIALKKERMNGCLATIAKILQSFASGPFSKALPEYKEWAAEFDTFGKTVEKLVDTKEQQITYQNLKDHNDVRRVILTCKELGLYAKTLTAPGEIKDKWVDSHPGLIWEPFGFTKFDIKHVWNNANATPNIKKYCLVTFRTLYMKCHEVWTITTDPDIDVKEFSKTIIASLKKASSIPALSRCKNAFKRITDSVDLLESNFGEYYKDMIESQNPSTIIESFVFDVSNGKDKDGNTKKLDAGLLREFRIIISHFREQSNGKIKDPRVKKLFDGLNDRMGLLDTQKKQVDIKDTKETTK